MDQKIKVTIKHKRPYKFPGREGVEITGFSYGGIVTGTGKGITFTGRNDYQVGQEIEVDLIEKWDEQNARVKFTERNPK